MQKKNKCTFFFFQYGCAPLFFIFIVSSLIGVLVGLELCPVCISLFVGFVTDACVGVPFTLLL